MPNPTAQSRSEQQKPEPHRPDHQKHEPGKPFQLDADAERVKWNEWQEKLNHEISSKLQKLVDEALQHGSRLPVGAEVDVDYSVGKNGGFGFKCRWNDSAKDATYGSIVNEAIYETRRYHPELVKFPEGTSRSEWKRTVTFSMTGGVPNYQTGEVQFESYKK